MWQLKDISIASHFHGQKFRGLRTWLPDQPAIRRGLFPCLEDHGNLMGNTIMEDLVKWMGVNTFQITCYFQVQVCEFWLTLGKLFRQTFSWEASFFCQHRVKKAGGGGHRVLISEVFFCWNEFLNQVFNLVPQHRMSRMWQNVVIAPHDQYKKDEQPKPQLNIFLGTC